MQKKITYRQMRKKEFGKLAKALPEIKKNTLSENETRFIALNSSKIVAHIKAGFSEEPYAHIAELRNLIVLPEHRGRGIGIGLYKYALEHLGKGIEIAIARVRTTNTASIRLHEKLGFKVAGKLEKGYKTKSEKADILIFSKAL